MSLSSMRIRMVLAADAFRLLIRATRIVRRRSTGAIALPPVAQAVPARMSEEEQAFIERWVGFLVRRVVWSARKCFLRSYVLACLLRRAGRPVVLNVGMHPVNGSGSVRGHCWLTLYGRPVAEPNGYQPDRRFPVLLSEASNGIVYWMGCSAVDPAARPSEAALAA